jgi:hypothetical protein
VRLRVDAPKQFGQVILDRLGADAELTRNRFVVFALRDLLKHFALARAEPDIVYCLSSGDGLSGFIRNAIKSVRS